MLRFLSSFYKSKSFLYLLLPISILIDCINGYTQAFLNIHLPVGIIYRSSILVLLFPCLFYFNPTYIEKTSRIIIGLLGFSILIWITFYNANIIKEIDTLSRISYFLLIICYFRRYGKYFSNYFLIQLVANYSLLIAGFLIFSFFTGITNYSYSEDYGFGVKSFFTATNDLGLTMILALIFNSIACHYFYSPFSLLRTICVSIGCFLIGSRVGVLGSILFMAYFIFYYLFIHKSSTNKARYKKIVFFVILTSLFLWKGIQTISVIHNSFDSYTLEKLTIEKMYNAREGLTDAADIYIKNFDYISLIIGKGSSTLYRHIADFVGSESENRSVEADYYDLIGSYGYLLGGLVLLLYVSFIYHAWKVYYTNKTYLNFSLFIMCLFFLVIAIVAGHAIKNVMVSPIYAIGIYLISANKKISNENPAHK